MDTKTKRLLGALVILLLAILLWWLWPKNPSVTPVTETPVVSEPEPEGESLVAPLVVRTEPTPSQASAETVARSFAERFASFSAESRYQNVKDLYPLMTASFRAEQQAQVARSEASSDYYGVTSSVLSLTTEQFDGASANVKVLLQRVEARGSVTNTTLQRETLSVSLVLEGGAWLVSGADWVK